MSMEWLLFVAKALFGDRSGSGKERRVTKGFGGLGGPMRPSDYLQGPMPTQVSGIRPGITPGYQNVKPQSSVGTGVSLPTLQSPIQTPFVSSSAPGTPNPLDWKSKL